MPPTPLTNATVLYSTYDKNLYRIDTAQGTSLYNPQSISQALLPDQTASLNNSLTIPANLVGSGQTIGTAQMVASSQSVGMTLPNDGNTGFWLGTIDGIPQFAIGNASQYLYWNGTNLTVTGNVSIGSLNIPDTTTANSFHVDSSGNTWWGANIAVGINGATASITSAGLAKFKNIQIGGASLQYQVTNQGYFSFGK